MGTEPVATATGRVLPHHRAGVVATPTVAGGLAGAVAAVALLAPWWRPGALLVRDLVAVPVTAVSWQLLDPVDRLPRDVPGEVVVAALGQVVRADLVVRLLLVVALVALAAGAGRLAGSGRRTVVAVVAGGTAVWNPFVWARLQQGQWLVLVALAAVPWVVVHLGAGDDRRLARTVVLAGVAGFVTTVVVLPTLVVVGAVTRRTRTALLGLGAWGLVSLPWLLTTGPVGADPDGFVAFAPSADLAAGPVASLLAGGGYFNTAIASPWRGRAGITVVVLALAALALWGAWHWLADDEDAPPAQRARWGLALAGATGVVVAAATTTTTVQRGLGAVAELVPATAVLRDSQRLVAPWVVLLAVGAGVVAGRLADRTGTRAGAAAVVAALVVLAMPDPVVGPRLPSPSTLPTAWTRAAAQVDADPAPGRLLVAPYGQTQRYGFTDHRPVAVPWRRLVARAVAVDSQLVVGTTVVDDDPDPLRSLAGRDLATVAATTLAEHGVRWVAVTDPDRFVALAGDGVQVVQDTGTLQLLRVDAPLAVVSDGPPGWLLVADGLVLLGALAVVVAPSVGRARERPDHRPRTR